MAAPHVVAVHRSSSHSFSKYAEEEIVLVEGRGVEGDAHAGSTVKHRSRVKRDAAQPNLRQVHLIHAELFDELVGRGFAVFPGDLGENITTRGIDLLGLPEGTLLSVGASAVVEITGLRNPCAQIDTFQPGLMAAVLDRDAAGQLIRKAGVMAVVRRGGPVRPGAARGRYRAATSVAAAAPARPGVRTRRGAATGSIARCAEKHGPAKVKLMGSRSISLRLLLLLATAGPAQFACAQNFAADYSLVPRLLVASGLGGSNGAGVSLQAGRSWFGQVGMSHSGPTEAVNLAGGYRFGDGQALSLQLNRGFGPGQRLGLAVNYDWPRYFVRFSYEPAPRITLTPQESLRFSAGVRF